MLFKPVYLKPKMREAPIPMSTPANPPPEPPDEQPQEQLPSTSNEEEQERLPVLVCTYGVQLVYPTEARRDVLAGRVAYIYVDDKGATVFKPKHMFSALKLTHLQRTKYEDYPCIGAHQWTLEKKSSRRRKRCTVQEELTCDEKRRQWAMNPHSRGIAGPRA